MPRSISLSLAGLIASGRCMSHSAVDLTVTHPNGTASVSRLATQAVTVNGNTYTPALKTAGVTQMSMTRSIDRAEFAVTNVNLAFGLSAVQAADVLMGARVTVSRVFTDLNTGAVYQTTLFVGVAVTARVDESEVRFTVISDVAAAGQVAGWRVMRTSCNWRKFKDADCGYAGALTTCNRLYDSPDGCSGRANQHRFGGFIFLTPKANEQNTTPADPNDSPVSGGSSSSGGSNPVSGGWRHDLPYYGD